MKASHCRFSFYLVWSCMLHVMNRGKTPPALTKRLLQEIKDEVQTAQLFDTDSTEIRQPGNKRNTSLYRQIPPSAEGLLQPIICWWEMWAPPRLNSQGRRGFLLPVTTWEQSSRALGVNKVKMKPRFTEPARLSARIPWHSSSVVSEWAQICLHVVVWNNLI